MTKFIPDFIQCQQEPFKGCSLWLSFPSGQPVFLNWLIFAIFHLCSPSWQLSCSGGQEAKLRSQGLQKRTMILDASCLFWTSTQNTLKKPGEKVCSLCCNCIIQPMNSWVVIIRVRVLQFQHESRMCNCWKSILLQLLKARDQALKGQEANLLHVPPAITCYLLLAIMYTWKKNQHLMAVK